MTWQSRQPRIYRFMDKTYVDEFFNSGILRLSSFKQFSRHTDEQRLDSSEGEAMVLHRTSENGGQTLWARIRAGDNAYVVCGSLTPSLGLMNAFNSDSGIVITDPFNFAKAIAAKILNFKSGIDGPCSYQLRKVIETRLPYIDFGETKPHPEHFRFPPGALAPVDTTKVFETAVKIASLDLLFLKDHHYKHQNEWRFVWFVEGNTDDFIDIAVPEAIQFCSRWEQSASLIAYP